MTPFIGVISDTHGSLRPEALTALQGSDLIVHAGDVGKKEVLEELATIAPVHAVCGNVDYGELGKGLPDNLVVRWQGFSLYVLHIIQELELDPASAGFQAVVYGHTHKPTISEKDQVLYLNPGSAGPRRFSLPVTVARVQIRDGKLHAEHVHLAVS